LFVFLPFKIHTFEAGILTMGHK